MTKTAIHQIIIAVATTVIAGLILDRMRQPEQSAYGPIGDDRNRNKLAFGLL